MPCGGCPSLLFHFISGVIFCGIQLVTYLDNTMITNAYDRALLATTLPSTDQMLCILPLAFICPWVRYTSSFP